MDPFFDDGSVTEVENIFTFRQHNRAKVKEKTECMSVGLATQCYH